VPFEALKLAAAAVALSPFLPLYFMGEEYGETAPFLYFISHGDADLVEAVRRGRREEFAAFDWQGEVPDPQAPGTFERSRLDRSRRRTPQGDALWRLHRELLRLRRTERARAPATGTVADVHVDGRALVVRREATGAPGLLAACNLSPENVRVDALAGGGARRRLLDTAGAEWAGPGAAAAFELAPWSCALYRDEESAA
jgi:maltooligosyltrehalose trehalohydrolase